MKMVQNDIQSRLLRGMSLQGVGDRYQGRPPRRNERH